LYNRILSRLIYARRRGEDAEKSRSNLAVAKEFFTGRSEAIFFLISRALLKLAMIPSSKPHEFSRIKTIKSIYLIKKCG